MFKYRVSYSVFFLIICRRKIIAGTGLHERTFNILISVLDKLPISRDWIQDKDSIPPQMLRGNDFLFANVEPGIVQATINYLSHTPQIHGPTIDRFPFVTTLQKTDVLFRVKLYKFALCLGSVHSQRTAWAGSDTNECDLPD